MALATKALVGLPHHAGLVDTTHYVRVRLGSPVPVGLGVGLADPLHVQREELHAWALQ
jgi:hypothetical protein